MALSKCDFCFAGQCLPLEQVRFLKSGIIFNERGLMWNNYFSFCTDGAPVLRLLTQESEGSYLVGENVFLHA